MLPYGSFKNLFIYTSNNWHFEKQLASAIMRLVFFVTDNTLMLLVMSALK